MNTLNIWYCIFSFATGCFSTAAIIAVVMMLRSPKKPKATPWINPAFYRTHGIPIEPTKRGFIPKVGSPRKARKARKAR